VGIYEIAGSNQEFLAIESDFARFALLLVGDIYLLFMLIFQ